MSNPRQHNAAQRRKPRGTSTGGQFDVSARSEPAIHLGPDPDAKRYLSSYVAQDTVPDETLGISRPDLGEDIADRELDVYAATYAELRYRDRVGSTLRDLRSWESWAHGAMDPLGPADGYEEQFMLGLRHAAVAFASHEDNVAMEHALAHAQVAMSQGPSEDAYRDSLRHLFDNPTSQESLTRWSLMTQSMPQDMRRGSLAAGIIVSGQGSWWRLRENIPR